MNLIEVIRIILVSKFADEVEYALEQEKISQLQFKNIFVAQADLMDTVTNALGETLNKSIDSLVSSQSIFISKELLSRDDLTDKDIAFYLLGNENDIPDELKSEKFISMKEEDVDNAVYDLFQFYSK